MVLKYLCVYIYIYTGWTILTLMENNSTGKRNNKKVSYKSYWTRRRTYDHYLEFDLDLDFRDYLKVK